VDEGDFEQRLWWLVHHELIEQDHRALDDALDRTSRSSTTTFRIVDFLREHPAVLGRPAGATSRAGPGSPELGSLGRDSARQFEHLLYRRNQFIHLSDTERASLEGLYREGLYRELFAAVAVPIARDASEAELATAASGVLQAHFARLLRFVDDLWHGPASARGFVLSSAVSSEYSPDLQLAVLGVELGELQEPILDVGCGEAAPLVRWLRDQGMDATGIDRLATPAPFVAVRDWLTYDYGVRRWGSILSHLGFSNHFVVYDQCGGGMARDYAGAYMAMLRSLRESGTFFYAPALPFIERHLPSADFAVSRHTVASDAFERLDCATRHALRAVAQAARVRRLR